MMLQILDNELWAKCRVTLSGQPMRLERSFECVVLRPLPSPHLFRRRNWMGLVLFG